MLMILLDYDCLKDFKENNIKYNFKLNDNVLNSLKIWLKSYAQFV